jgi:cytoskeleton protein RodZ
MAPANAGADTASAGPSAPPASLVLDSADAAASSNSPSPVLDPRLTQPAAAVAATPAASSLAGPAATPQATPTMPVAVPANVTVPASGAGAVTLAVRDASWIEVRDARGAKLLSRHVQAGESLALDGVAPFSLRIGNAPGVQLSYKGQAIDLAPMTRNNVARVELK